MTREEMRLKLSAAMLDAIMSASLPSVPPLDKVLYEILGRAPRDFVRVRIAIDGVDEDALPQGVRDHIAETSTKVNGSETLSVLVVQLHVDGKPVLEGSDDAMSYVLITASSDTEEWDRKNKKKQKQA